MHRLCCLGLEVLKYLVMLLVSSVSHDCELEQKGSTYQNLSVSNQLGEEFCARNVHLRIVNHAVQLGGKRENVVATLLLQWEIFVVQELLIEDPQRHKNFYVRFENHGCLVGFVRIDLHVLQVFWLKHASSLAMVAAGTLHSILSLQ